MLTHEALKTRQRAIRHTFPEGLGLRVHRALSWLNRADQESEDDDARFIFLWIGFNAAYAQEMNSRTSQPEQGLFIDFLQKLINLDKEDQIYTMLWGKYSSSIRLLLDNPYVYQPFWDFHAEQGTDERVWKDRFEQSKQTAGVALANKDSLTILRLVLNRLYVLRNQLVHGAATWNSKQNRQQMADGARFMGELLPLVIHLMMENSNRAWGEASYPVVA